MTDFGTAHFVPQETRAAFQAEAKQSGKTELLMTAAVAAGKSYIDSAYDVPAMAK